MRLKRIAAISLIALSLSGCAVLAGYPNPNASYFSKLPAPIAAEGEPAIEMRKGAFRGDAEYSQVFFDDRIYQVPAGDWSIARLYRSFGDRQEDVGPQIIPVVCPIGETGIITLSNCLIRDDATEDQRLALALISRGGQSMLPSFRELPVGYAYLARTVNLQLGTPAVSSPKVNLAAGPMVEASLLQLEAGGHSLGTNNYPSRALRQEIQGDMVAECQVQTDLSVICKPVSFDPAEHFAIFAREGERLYLYSRMAPLLTDGSDARGVRFMRTVKWRIPGASWPGDEVATPPASPQPE